MKIADQCFVSIKYTLKDGDGNTLDTTDERGPLTYVQGTGNIIPGLENALLGKEVGEKVQVVIKPVDGYGERRDELVQDIPIEHFESADGVAPGMQFELQTEEGILIVTVLKVDGDAVVIDGNHPLAGVTMDFDVEVLEVRLASEEDIRDSHNPASCSSCSGCGDEDGEHGCERSDEDPCCNEKLGGESCDEKDGNCGACGDDHGGKLKH